MRLRVLIFILVILATAASSWYATKSYYGVVHEAFVSKLEEDTQKKINEVERTKRELEISLNASKDRLESMYENQINAQNATIDRLIADGIRLREPTPDRSSSAVVSSDTRSTSCTEETDSGGRVLYPETSEFLLRLAGEADQTLEQLRLCKAWVEKIESINPES